MTERIRFYERTLARMSRRELLNAAWKLGVAAVMTPPLSRELAAQAVLRGYPFTLGVASGDPWPESVVLWTRLAPAPLDGGGMPAANVEVGWEIAGDVAFRTIVRRGTAMARPELGHSVHVEADGLQPGREYWYRFHCGGDVSQVGRTRTAPAAGASVDELRFGVCGCNHYEQGYFSAYRDIAGEQFDFVFHTGDYIYEAQADTGNPALVRRHNGHEVQTLVDYRNRYALYKSDPDLIAAHQSAPFVVSWDDHEVVNDYAGDSDARDTPPEVFLLRRAAAYQAYFESMPLRASLMPSGPGMRLHRRLQFGSLLDLSVLDTRQYRSKQACGGGARSGCAEVLAAGRSMLGAEQERWLWDNLAAVPATWTVLGQQVPTFARDAVRVNPDGRFAMDKWDGYVVARQRLYSRLKEAKAPNPVVLSGDVHAHWGADLKMDYGDPKSETIGVELTNTSVTSGGDGSDAQAMWEGMRADNPHIRYHSNRRGYIACTATRQALRADFRILDKVTVPNLPARTGGSLLIEAGRPGSLPA